MVVIGSTNDFEIVDIIEWLLCQKSLVEEVILNETDFNKIDDKTSKISSFLVNKLTNFKKNDIFKKLNYINLPKIS